MPARALELSSDADKYYQMLQRRPDSAVLYQRFYDAWLDANEIDALEVFLKQAASQDAATVVHLRLLATFYLYQGDEGQALRALRSAVALEPQSGVLRLELARVQLSLLRYAEAVESLQAALKLELDEVQAIEGQRLLGTAYARAGQFENANAAWQQLLPAYPNESELMEDLIDLQIGEGLLTEALATAEQLVKTTREPYQRALYSLWVGDILLRQGQQGAALELYRDLLDRVGAGSWLEREVLVQINQALGAAQGAAAALEFYEKLCAQYPLRTGLRQVWLDLLASSGKVDEAVAQYQQLLQLTPGDRGNREGYIQLLARSGRIEAARSELRQLCQLYPKDAALHLELVDYSSQLDDEAGVRSALEAYAQCLSSDSHDALRVTRLYERYGFETEAGAQYAALTERFPEDVDCVESYAFWLIRNERAEEALQLWQALSESQQRDGLLRIAQSMVSARQEGAAYTLLKARLAEFETDTIYLQQLCRLAMNLNAAEEALPWVRTQLLQAQSALEVSAAVTLATSVIKDYQGETQVVQQLQSADTLVLSELSLLAQLQELQGDRVASEATLQRIREHGGLVALSEEVRIWESRGRRDEALRAMEQLVALPAGRNPVNLRHYVSLLESEAKWERALVALEQWKQLSPGDPQVWLRESDILVASNQLELAVRQMRRARHQFDDEIELQLRLADLYRQSQQFAEAERIYWRLYESNEDPKEKLRWVGELAQLARASGDWDGLIQQLEALRDANRQSILPLLALAQVYQLNNYVEQRRALLLEASILEPNNIAVLDQLATVYESVGDYVAAEASLQRIATQNPTDASRRRLVQFYLRSGEINQAFGLIKSTMVTQQSPENLEAFVDVLMSNGEWDYAEAEALKALEQYPNDWRLGYQLAVCYRENGRDAQALQLFLDLCGKETELTRLPAPSTAMSKSMQERYATLPDDLVDLFRITQDNYKVFKYQQQHRQHAAASSVASGITRFVALPDSVSALHRWTALQLTRLVLDLSATQSQATIDQMAACGIPSPELLVAMQNGGVNGSNALTSVHDYVLKHPKDEVALGVLFQYIANNPFAVSPEVVQRGVDTFLKKSPMLGLQYAMLQLRMSSEEEQDASLLDAILSSLESLESLDAQWQLNVMSQLLNIHNYGQALVEIQFNEAQQARLLTLLKHSYQQCANSTAGAQGKYSVHVAFHMLSLLAIEAGDTKRFLTQLEAHQQLLKDPKLQAFLAQIIPHIIVNQANAEYAAPSFSPLQTGFVELPIALYFEKGATRRSGMSLGMMSAKQRAQIDALDFGAHLDSIQDPRLRLLAASRADQIEQCDALFAELLSGDSLRFEDLILYAGWQYEVKQQSEAAMASLERALEWATDRRQRKQVDMAMVGLGVALVQAGQDSVEELEIARNAALRLERTAFMPTSERQSLVTAMTALKMSDAVARLQTASTASGINPFGGGRAVYLNPAAPQNRSQQNDPKERMVELANAGKQEAALSIAIRELRSALRQYSNNRYALDNLIKRIQAANLSELVLARFKPQDSESRRRMEQYAQLLNAFHRPEAAAVVWRQLYDLRPTEIAYALEVAHVSEPKVAQSVLQQALEGSSSHMINAVGPWIIQNQQQNHSFSFEQWMRLITLATEVLQQVDPAMDGSQNFTWAPYLALQFAGRTHIDSMSFPSYVKRGRQLDLKGKGAELEVQRARAYKDLCEAMLRHPDTAEQGFMLIYRKHEILDEPLETPDLLALARAAVLCRSQRESSAKVTLQHSAGPWAYVSNGARYHGQALESSVQPIVYLAAMTAQQGESALRALQAKFETVNPEYAQDLRFFADIVFADAASTNVIEELQEWQAESSDSATSARSALMLESVRHVSDRKAALSLLMPHYLPKAQNSYQWQAQDIERIRDFALSLLSLGQPDLLEEYFNRLAEDAMGPRAGWEALVRQPRTNHYSYGMNVKSPNRYYHLMQQLGQSRDLTLAIIRYGNRNGIGSPNYLGNQLSGQLRNFTSVSSALEWCEAQQLFTDLASFDPLIALDQQSLQLGDLAEAFPTNRNTVVYEQSLRMIDFTGEAKGEMKKAFIAELKQRGFGAQLLAAFMLQQEGRELAIAAIEAEAESFFALPESRRAELAFLYKYWLRPGTSTEADSPVVQSMIEIFNAERFAVMQAYLSEDAAMDPNRYSSEKQSVYKWIESYCLVDPELCAKLFAQWSKRELQYQMQSKALAERQRIYERRRIWNAPLNRGRNNEEALLPLSQFYALLQAQGDPYVSLLDRQFSENVARLWQTVFESKLGSLQADYASIIAVLPELALQMETPEQQAILAAGLAQFSRNRVRLKQGEEEASVVSAVTALNAESSVLERVFGASLLAQMARQSDRDLDAAKTKEALAEVKQAQLERELRAAQALADLLADAQLSLEAKLGLLNVFLHYNEPRFIEQAVLAVSVAHVLEAYVDAGRPAFNDDWAEMLWRLQGEHLQSSWRESLLPLLPKLVQQLPTQIHQQDQDNAKKAVRAVIAIAVDLGESATVRQLTRQYFGLIDGDARILFALIEAGEIEEAIRITARDGTFSTNSGMRYTQALHRHLPEYLNRITNPTVKYQLNFSLSSLQDASDLHESEVPLLSQRAETPLAAFGPHRDTPQASRQLARLCEVATDLTLAIPFLETLVGDADFEALLAQSKSGDSDGRRLAQERLQLLKYLLQADIKAGNFERITALFAQMEGMPEHNDLRKVRNDMQDGLKLSIFEGAEARTAEEWQAYLPLLRVMLQTAMQPNSTYYDHLATCYLMYLVANVGAGEAESIGDELPDTVKNQIAAMQASWSSPERIFRYVGNVAGRKPEDAGKRQLLLRHLLSEPALVTTLWSSGADALVSQLNYSSEDEIIDLNAVFPRVLSASHPRADWIRELQAKQMLKQKDVDTKTLLQATAVMLNSKDGAQDWGTKLRPFTAHWKALYTDFIADVEGGESAQLQAFAAELKKMEATLSDPMAAQIGALSVFTYAVTINPKSVDFDQAEWLAALAESDSIMVRCFILGLLVRDNGDRDPRNPLLRAQWESVLKDASLPFPLRFKIFSQGLRNNRYKLLGDPESLELACEMLTSYIERGYDLFDGYVGNVFLKYIYREKLADANNAVVQTLKDEWVAALLAVENPKSSYDVNRTLTWAVLLSMKLGDAESVVNLAKHFPESKWANVDVLLWLLRYELYEIAVDQLEKQDLLGYREYSFGYDSKVHAHLPKLLERLEDPVQRYRVAVTVSVLVDSKQFPLAAGEPNRSARCQALFQSYSEHAKDPGADKLLDVLTDDDVTADLAFEWVVEQTKDCSMEDFLAKMKKRKLDRNRLSLYTKRLSLQAKHGDLAWPLAELEAMQSMVFGSSEYSWIRPYIYKLHTALYISFLDQVAAQDGHDLSQWLPVSQALCRLYCNSSFTRNARNQFRGYLFHLMAQQVVAPGQEMTEAMRADLSNPILDEQLDEYDERCLSNVDDGIGSGTNAADRRRLKTALGLLLMNPNFYEQRWVNGPNALLGRLTWETTFKRRAVTELLTELISESHPREPWMAYLLGDYSYGGKDGDPDAALLWFTRAREAALTRHPDFRTTAGDATLKMVTLLRSQTNGVKRALQLLESTPADCFSDEAATQAAQLQAQLTAED